MKKRQPSDCLFDLLQLHDIQGSLILLRDDGKGTVKISQAFNSTHRLGIVAALASIILELQRKKDNGFTAIIRNSAQTILQTCDLIKGLTTDGAEENLPE